MGEVEEAWAGRVRAGVGVSRISRRHHPQRRQPPGSVASSTFAVALRRPFTEDDGLTVVVTEMEHWLHPDAPDVTRHRSITVVAHQDPSSREMTQKLLDPAELERWLTEYPWLSEYP